MTKNTPLVWKYGRAAKSSEVLLSVSHGATAASLQYVLAPMPTRQIPVHSLNVMNNTILIWIQAACTFDRRRSSSAAADADVKYMLLLVLKYAG